MTAHRALDVVPETEFPIFRIPWHLVRILTQSGPSESVATLDRGPRLEDHVTLSELGRIDEAF